MVWLDKISFTSLFIVAIALGLAPFSSQPHLLQKLQMLLSAELSKPIDIFDLFMHSVAIILLLLKFARQYVIKQKL